MAYEHRAYDPAVHPVANPLQGAAAELFRPINISPALLQQDPQDDVVIQRLKEFDLYFSSFDAKTSDFCRVLLEYYKKLLKYRLDTDNFKQTRSAFHDTISAFAK